MGLSAKHQGVEYHVRIIDSHCHLDDPRFDDNRLEVINRAVANEVSAIVVPATTAQTWSRSRGVAESNPGVYWTAGLHPYFLDQHQPVHLAQLRAEIEQHRPIAIGECGLDFFLRGLDPKMQRFYFIEQLKIASDNGLPVVVHARKSVDQVTQTLRAFPDVRAQIHSYPGSEQQAQRLIENGHMISIGSRVLFDQSVRFQKMISRLPLASLLVETDAPDQPGPDHRGQLNEPAFVREVVSKLAELRQVDAEIIAEKTTLNAETFFGMRFKRLKSTP